MQAIFLHWNEQKITVHQTLSTEAEKEIEKLLKKKTVQEIKNLISLFGTVYRGPEYFWTHKWNLYEFLKRGTSRFDGKIPQDFIRAGQQSTAPKQY